MHIVVDQGHAAETTYPIDTPEQTAKARAALREADKECAHIYVGEGPDAYCSGGLLWAAEGKDTRLERAVKNITREQSKNILAYLRTELLREDLALKRAGEGMPEDIVGLGRAIAEYGAMLVDVGQGRKVSQKGSTTKKVRAAVGYTNP